MTNQAPAKNNQPAPATVAIQSRPGRPVCGINTPTPLEPMATAPSRKQITVPSAHPAPTVESLSVLITATLALRYRELRLRAPTLPGLLILVRLGQEKRILNSQATIP